jgi:hypothetical protein
MLERDVDVECPPDRFQHAQPFGHDLSPDPVGGDDRNPICGCHGLLSFLADDQHEIGCGSCTNRFLGVASSAMTDDLVSKGRRQHWSPLARAVEKKLVDFVDKFFGESLGTEANSSIAQPAPG